MADGAAVLETERLVFRREQPGDLETWLAHMNTPTVMACTGGVQTAENIAATFARMAADGADPITFHFLARKSDGLLIGKCGLSRIDTDVAPGELREAVQVGWTLRADCWRHGYAREAAEAALEVAFEQVGLATVYAQTSERNVASWGLMKRLGMERRADLDYDDPDYPPEDNPTMVWALTRESWRARNG
jgi:RimJ/RimL family protein N-acetyltransferase